MQTQAATYVDFVCQNPALPESVKDWVRTEVPLAFETISRTPGEGDGTIVHDFIFDAQDGSAPLILALVLHLSTTVGRMNIIVPENDELIVDEFDFLMQADGTAQIMRDGMRSHRSITEARELAERFATRH